MKPATDKLKWQRSISYHPSQENPWLSEVVLMQHPHSRREPFRVFCDITYFNSYDQVFEHSETWGDRFQEWCVIIKECCFTVTYEM